LEFALKFFNSKASQKFKFLKKIVELQKEMGIETEERHQTLTSQILSGKFEESIIVEAAGIRGFLG